jgi:maltooligosyltrehalose trehalohydrolase
MTRDLGAVWSDNHECRFRVWAPHASKVDIHVVWPYDRVFSMKMASRGYHDVTLGDIPEYTRYFYRLSGDQEFADPASRHQPAGVFGPSEVIPDSFDWQDRHWFGIPKRNYIIYELHVGTFTPEGTFEAIITHLDDLRDLGITALELMPVGQFPGGRNWGYDGVFPFAVQNSYGGPLGLKRLVNACHQRGLAVILDVVYNHLGPEGNCLPHFGPYLSDRYKTPWGPSINFDGPYSDEVRRFFIANALYWITEYHIDALRLDAVHAILDHSALHFLEELSETVHDQGTILNRLVYTIAESALNDTRLVRSTELGGYGIDAQWNDDFHHSMHTLLTKEREGYYVDFGDFQHMAQAFSEGFVYTGRYSVTRRRKHGNSSRNISPDRFVVYLQNHDQISNRMMRDRISQMISFAAFKLAAGAVLLSPFLPLLFMGDEYGETAPFLYFVSHSDPQIVDAVRRGRREEFASFEWAASPPDPQDEKTFERSKLNRRLRRQGQHHILFEFHKELIRLRKSLPALGYLSKDNMDVFSLAREQVLIVRRWKEDNEALAIFNFSDRQVGSLENLPYGRWRKILNSEEDRWMGRGDESPRLLHSSEGTRINLSAKALLLFVKESED